MRPIKTLWQRLLTLWQRPALKHSIDEELRFHIDQQTAQNLAAGMAPEEAAREARKGFGNLRSIREECRDARGASFGGATLQDVRFGLRLFAKSPGFTATAVLILALGIGANTAIFSVLNAFMLRPLPFEKEKELVAVYENNPSKGLAQFAVSGTRYLDWRQQNDVFQEIGAIRTVELNLTGQGEPTPITALEATPSYLRALRVQPLLGRVFAMDEDQAGKTQVLLLGHRLWKGRFGGRADIVGQIVRLNDNSYTIVGVLPGGQAFLEGDDVAFVPLSLEKLKEDRGHWCSFEVLARLKPGVSVSQSQAAMSAIARRLEKTYQPGWGVVIKSLREDLLGGWPNRQTILLLQGAVLLVLLIACANTANLLLARSASREREFAVRLAMGGSRFRVIRQLLVESVLLASLGGAAGVVLGAAGIAALNAWFQAQAITLWSEIRLDRVALGFSLLLSLITGVLFGLVPALRTVKADIQSALKSASRAATGSVAHRRTLDALAVAEIGLALVLLIGAGLFGRNLLLLRGTSPGFDPENVLTMRVTLPQTRYVRDEQRSQFFDAALERVAALPSVQHAAVINTLPMGGTSSLDFNVEGRHSDAPDGSQYDAQVRRISADYFRAMGGSLTQGRCFGFSDRKGTESVVVVNECLAQRCFPAGNVLGARLSIGDGMVNPRTIVGVVKDERVFGLTGDIVPILYVPYDQGQWGSGTTFHFLIRTGSDPLVVAKAAQTAIREIDPQITFASVQLMDRVVSGSLFSERVGSFLLGTFSLTALLLAALGIYGVMANAVSQRTNEIGIRMALGAQTDDVLQLVMGRGLMLTAMGLGLGLAAALAFTRFLRSFLYGISPTDPWTFAVLTLVLATVALLACWLPARRATKIDPMTALRCE